MVRNVARWRTSTWLYLLGVVGAIIAETASATSDDPHTQELQGNALAALVFLTIVFVLYRRLTRDRAR